MPAWQPPQILGTGRCAKCGSLFGLCVTMAWLAPRDARSYFHLQPQGGHVCPLSTYCPRSDGAHVGLHGTAFCRARLVTARMRILGCLHFRGSHAMCPDDGAASFCTCAMHECPFPVMWPYLPGSAWICVDLPEYVSKKPGGQKSAYPAEGIMMENDITVSTL